MKAKKYILTACSLLMACGMLVGCSKQEPKETVKVATCKSNDKGNNKAQLNYVLADDGKTVTEFSYVLTIDEGFLNLVKEKNAEAKNKSIKELYDAFAEDLRGQYEYFVTSNENHVWIKSKLVENPESNYAQFTSTIDTANESLDMNDVDTVNFLALNAVDELYNKAEKKFLYNNDEMNELIKKSAISNPSCSINEVEKQTNDTKEE